MLTHIAIANAKPAAKPYNLTDGDGLFVTVKTNGSKLWRFRYRFHKRQKTLHFGKFPSVSLADARERCEEARRHIAAGLDPALLKKQARDAAKLAAANTFRAVAEEWYRKCVDEGLADVTMRKIRWLLDIAYQTLATQPITAITPPDCLTVLRKLEGTGRRESARRMRSVLGRVFRFSIWTGRASLNPAADLRGAIAAPIVTNIAAITKAGSRLAGAARISRAWRGPGPRKLLPSPRPKPRSYHSQPSSRPPSHASFRYRRKARPVRVGGRRVQVPR